jgi:hypothetical protein
VVLQLYFKGSHPVLRFLKVIAANNLVPPNSPGPKNKLIRKSERLILRGGQKDMKTIFSLLLSVLLMATGAFAQQQAGSTQQDSKSVTTAKPAKKSVSKKKSRKEQKEQKEVAREAEQEALPPLLSTRLRKFAETIPANGGLSNPGGAADQQFFHRAYPDTDIPLERILGARTAHANIAARPGAGGSGQWVSYGPTLALYPFTPLRNFSLYVPNAYPAASRTTSMALSPRCTNSSCTLWAGTAGGGVWRTRDPLGPAPHWTYLSSVFQINSIGSIEMDPNDPTGETLWVGTGEANACGSGCEAGVGLYKSTDGGDTWQGPLGQSSFNARAVGSIAIKPGDPNTIYAATTRALRGQASVCCNGVVTLIPGAAKWGLYKSTDGGQTWNFIHNGSADPTVCTGTAAEAGNGDPCSPRGVRRVLIDPSDPNTVYASSYARGV